MRSALIVFAVLAIVRPCAAQVQGRGPQIATGAGLASLGVYGAFADRDCDNHRQTTLQNGRCEWRNSRGRLVGEQPDLPAAQVAGGLAVAGIGGLMAGGVWAPSRTTDAILTAGAGAILLAVAFDDNYIRGTVHVESRDRRFTICQRGDTSWGADDAAEAAELCMNRSFSRLHAMWAGIASLGLAAGRWLWRDDPGPALHLDVGPGRVRVSKTIGF